MEKRPQVIVAGHICIDMFPQFFSSEGVSAVDPGSLVNIGPARFSPGGVVGNVGLALHRLGIPTGLMAKVGKDQFGEALLAMMRRHDPALAEAMIISDAEPTSYSIVVEPPGIDRTFWHCSGANDTLVADDFDPKQWEGAELFHFGYPPIMPAMHANEGAELVKLFERVKSSGVTTSLDMCEIDPASQAGQVDWRVLLENVLPYVDLFAPSYSELAWMIGKVCVEETADVNKVAAGVEDLGRQMLALGAQAVAIKVGDKGLYLRTGENCKLGKAWDRRELWHPCYQVKVEGTTGSGDCTVAGLLASLLHKLTPNKALAAATGVGAFGVEDVTATDGVPTWDKLQQRIGAGWTTLPFSEIPDRWQPYKNTALLVGPNDHTSDAGDPS